MIAAPTSPQDAASAKRSGESRAPHGYRGATAGAWASACLGVLTLAAGARWWPWTAPGWATGVLATVAVGCASWAWPRRGGPAAPRALGLGVVAVVATYLWSWYTVVSGHGHGHFAAAAIAVAVLACCELARSRSPLPQAADVPWWLAGLVALAGLASLIGWATREGLDAGVGAGLAVLLCGTPGAWLICLSSPLRQGLRRGAPIGLRLPGPHVLQAARTLDRAVLDTHRTVTTGQLSVVAVRPVEPDHDRNLRWFAGALAHAWDTRTGRAVARLSVAGRLGEVEQLPGRGIRGSVDRHPVRVGDPGWLDVAVPEGIGDPVAVEVDGRILGHLRVADEVREQADRGADELRSMGIDPLLVSDRGRDETARLAAISGIEDARHGTDDNARAEIVARLQADGHDVMVVGGPSGNAESLATADLAVTVDCAPGPCGLVLADLDIAWVVQALRLCRGLYRRVRANRILAWLAIVLPVPCAGAGLLPPWGAASAVALFAILVELNSRTLARPSAVGTAR